MNTVTVAFNDKIEASDAARELGCAYSTVVALLARKKLKGQKINRRWFVDYDDLQRAKSTHLIKTRISKVRREKMSAKVSQLPLSPNGQEDKPSSKAELRFYIDKEKVTMLQAALQSVDKSLAEYVNEKVDDLYNKVLESLKNLKV